MTEEKFDNTLERNFIKCFAPIHVVQILLGCPSIDIVGSVIRTKATNNYKIYSVICLLAITFSFVYILTFFYKFYSRDLNFYIIYCLVATLFFNTHMLNFIHISFYEDRVRSIKLYFLLQKIDRTLGSKRCESLLRVQYYINISLLLLLVGLTISGTITYICNVLDRPGFTVFYSIAFCSAQVSLFRCWSSVLFVTFRLRFLNKIIRFNILSKFEKNINRYYKDSTRLYKYLSRQWPVKDLLMGPNFYNNPMELKKIVICLKDILKAFGIIVEQYSFIMFITVCTLFVYTFLAIELVFLGTRNGLMSNIASVVSLMSILIYLIMLSYLAALNAWFTSETKTTKILCVRILSHTFEGPIYAVAKKMLKALESEQTEFAVYDIFTVNKTFPLKLYSIIINQVLVMIQLTI